MWESSLTCPFFFLFSPVICSSLLLLRGKWWAFFFCVFGYPSLSPPFILTAPPPSPLESPPLFFFHAPRAASLDVLGLSPPLQYGPARLDARTQKTLSVRNFVSRLSPPLPPSPPIFCPPLHPTISPHPFSPFHVFLLLPHPLAD